MVTIQRISALLTRAMFLSALVTSHFAAAETFQLPPGSSVIGELRESISATTKW
jgi:hypothetical protein